MVEEGCLFRWRRWVHENEEGYVVIHCGRAGELVYLSFSEMVLNIEESVHDSWWTLLHAMEDTV